MSDFVNHSFHIALIRIFFVLHWRVFLRGWVTRFRQDYGEAREVPIGGKPEKASPRVPAYAGARLRFNSATDRIVGMKEGMLRSYHI